MKKFYPLVFCLFFNYIYSQAPQTDCPSRPVCADYGPTNKLAGIGAQEINAANQGCLSIEHNSDWITISILTGGTLNFTVNPNGATDDFDFAMWGPNSPCPPTVAPVRCSWAAGSGNNTGLNSANNAPQVDNSEGAGGNHWVQTLNVVAGQTYLILVDNFSSNRKYRMSFGGTATLDCALLPIELATFEGLFKDGKNILTWETRSEKDNSFFTVQRSIDGISFTDLGEIEGAGNSTRFNTYQFEDKTFESTVNYYRLKHTDFFGQSYYAKTININNSKKEMKVIKVTDVTGRQVNDDYKGFRFLHYQDGSVEKKAD